MMKGHEEPADTNNHFHTVAILTVVALCYANALYCGFVFDDSSAIVNNKDLLPSTPIWNIFKNDFWGTPMHKEESHKSYRPFCVLTFRLNYALHELHPVGYHLVNVILHGIVCVLVMRVFRHFFDERPSFMAAVLFAVHPIHTEAVTGVVGRAELLSCLFSLIAFLSYAKSTRHHRQTDWGCLFLTILLVTIATLCKEQGITMVGICCCYEILVVQKLTVPKLINIMTSHKSRPNNNNSSATPTKTQRKKQSRFPPWLRASIIRISVLFIATMFLLFARMRIMGTQLPVFTRFDNPASVASFPTRHLTYWYLLPVNAWLLLCPSQLCCDWTMGTIPLVTSAIDPRNLATAAFVMIIIWLGCYAVFVEGKRSRQVAMSLCFLVLPFIPASNLFFPVGFVVAERVLYVPSIGYSMLFAVVYTILQQRNVSKFVLHFLVSTLLIVYATKTVTRNLDWESEYTLFQAGLKVTTNNAKLWNNVGHALEQEEKWQDALRYFQQATNVQTDDAGAWINVGRAFKHIGNYTEAEKAYEVAKNLLPPVIPGQKYVARVAPTHLSAYVNLANIIKMNTSRLQEADKFYITPSVLCPDGTSECPDGTTYCKLTSGQWGYCPIQNAVCCSDGEHCCPAGYTCDVTAGMCSKTSSHQIYYQELLAYTGNTCCKYTSSQWYCCPLPEGVCCSDRQHCCPAGYVCDVSTETCSWSSSHQISYLAIAGITSNVVCPGGLSSCQGGTTCCKLTSGGHGCCPFPKAVCCSDGEHCCPDGYACDLSTSTCTKSDEQVFLAAVEELKAAVECSDGISSCPGGKTCCVLATGQYGCCP